MPKVKLGKYFYDKNDLIGEGRHCSVFKGYQLDDKRRQRPVSIKVIPKKLVSQKDFDVQLSEITLLKYMDSEFFTKLHSVEQSSKNFYVISEFCNGGTLKELIYRKKQIPEQEAIVIMRQLVACVQQIYDQQCIHKDFKLENILFQYLDTTFNGGDEEAFRQIMSKQDLVKNNVNIQIKLQDLALSKNLNSQYQQFPEDTLMMSPERLSNTKNKSSIKLDVWTIGCLYFELLTGLHMFDGKHFSGQLQLSQSQLEQLSKQGGPQQFDQLSQIVLSKEGVQFLNKCLTLDANQRMSWNELINDPYLDKKRKIGFRQTTKLQVSKHTNRFQTADGSLNIDINIRQPKLYVQFYRNTVQQYKKYQEHEALQRCSHYWQQRNLDKFARLFYNNQPLRKTHSKSNSYTQQSLLAKGGMLPQDIIYEVASSQEETMMSGAHLSARLTLKLASSDFQYTSNHQSNQQSNHHCDSYCDNISLPESIESSRDTGSYKQYMDKLIRQVSNNNSSFKETMATTHEGDGGLVHQTDKQSLPKQDIKTTPHFGEIKKSQREQRKLDSQPVTRPGQSTSQFPNHHMMLCSYIPQMTRHSAILVLVLNVFIPSFGTFVSACIDRQKMKSSLAIACGQLVLVPVLFIGWVWSVLWGVKILNKAKRANQRNNNNNQVKQRNHQNLVMNDQEQQLLEPQD